MDPSQAPNTTSAQNQTQISGLREQIRSNAGLLFPHASKVSPAHSYDIVITTYTTDSEKFSPNSKPRYQAVLTYASGTFTDGMYKNTIAAKGAPSSSIVESLEALLHVLASALEKYNQTLFKSPSAPEGMGDGGMVDQVLIVGKGWKGFFGKQQGGVVI